jgi:hypothetical protein
MTTQATTGLYEFDPYGSNPNNLIPNERQTLQVPGRDDFYFIIPQAAPFFVEGFELVNDNTNTPYIEGVDFLFGHYFVEAMDAIGRPIAGSIRFIKRDISGIVRMRYRTLGGQWGFSEQAILAELSNKHYNPITRSWAQIDVLPATFPPVPHDQQLDDLVGSDELLVALTDIADAVVEASSGANVDHLNDYNNPHRTTKTHVGLGNVPNYPPATQLKAEDGLDNASLMTPRTTAQAITKQALTPLNAHIADKNNPHQTTKLQVGLGNVANYPPATPEEAVDTTRNDRYLTPYSAAALLQQNSDSGRIDQLEQELDNHQLDLNNPHRTTAEQVGTYDKATIDQKLATVSAQDTPRFAGMTDAEWRQTLPSFEDVEDILDTLTTEYTDANAGALTINVNPAALPARVQVAAITTGYDRYALHLSNGQALEVPQPALFTDTITADEQIAFTKDAAYRVTEEGFIEVFGSAAIQPPASYRVGAIEAPTSSPWQLAARREAVYVVLTDDSLLRFDAAGGTIVVGSGVDGVYTNTTSDALNVEHTLVVMLDGTVQARGHAAFVTAANAVLAGIVDAVEAAVGESHMVVLHDTGLVSAWAINNPGSATTVTALPAIEGLFTAVSGRYRHLVLLGEDQTVTTLGDNNPLWAIDPEFGPFVLADAGFNYSVTVNTAGETFYWGATDDNSHLPPSF